MELIRPALDDSVDLRALAAAELRGGHAGLHAELLNGVVDAEARESAINLRVHVADAVD
jgi:hypothetical protein